MVKIRIPVSQIDDFKAFCRAFAKSLEAQSGIRLRGNKLLNAVAQAAGHDSYTALLIDSKTFGKGQLNWSSLPKKLSLPLSEVTDQTLSACQIALSSASKAYIKPHAEPRSIGTPADQQLTIGEAYAGRHRPQTLTAIDSHVCRHLAIQARNHFPNDPLGIDELNLLAKYLHQLVAHDTDISEADIAGWIIDEGHPFGVSAPKQIQSILAPSLKISVSSVRDIDLAFRRRSLKLSDNNRFFHNRGHSFCTALANKLAAINPGLDSPSLANAIMKIETLNQAFDLLCANPKSSGVDEALERSLKSYTASDMLVRQFSENDHAQFGYTYGYIRHTLMSSSFVYY